MLVPPVGRGVERLEGNSEVKMVAVDGDKVYFCAKIESRAGVKPIVPTNISRGNKEISKRIIHTPNPAPVSKNDEIVPQSAADWDVWNGDDGVIDGGGNSVKNALATP